MKKDEMKFYTARGYELLEKERRMLTHSMEDYLEMAFRLSQEKNYIRIGDLASALNVQPPSVSNMIKKLAQLGFVKYEKYGLVILTDKGMSLGEYYLARHETIEKFLTIIGNSDDILQETEKIEHNLSHKTVHCLKMLIKLFANNEQLLTVLRQME